MSSYMGHKGVGLMSIQFMFRTHDQTLHVEAEPGDGTRYDFVAMKDPYGGHLIIWPVMGQVWRYFIDKDELVELSKDINPHSTKAIHETLKFLKNSLMFVEWGE